MATETGQAPPRLVAGALTFAAATGWRRSGYALGLGCAAAAALPPVQAWPLLWPAFGGLALLLDRTTGLRTAFGLGWWFGLGYFVAGLYWLAWPLTVDGGRLAWAIPFAVLAFPAGLAIFCGLATAAVHLTRLRGVARIVALAVAWTAAEWLRGHVLTGFPWNLVATAWAGVDPLLQPAAYVGAYGLGLLTVLVAALPALALDAGLDSRGRALAAVCPLALLAAMWTAGALRLGSADGDPVPGVRLRLVQGNVPQSLKWERTRSLENFERHLELTARPPASRITHVVWPESSIDYRLATRDPLIRLRPDRRRRLAAAVPEGGALMLGALRDDGRRVFNSIHVLDDRGAIRSTYDKHHLVPFGEYLPFGGLLEGLGVERVSGGTGAEQDLDAGPGPATLPVPGVASAAPLVCYEAIFPGDVTAGRRPGWLLNVTNDAWFGRTSGPYQHLAAARLRAVEEGLPLVRAANTGVTAVVDAHGRVRDRLPPMEAGVLDADLPRALARRPPYARFGDRALLALMLSAAATAALLRRRRPAARRSGATPPGATPPP